MTGDPFDFAGPGATPTNKPFAGHVKVWIGRGDQVTIPRLFLDEMPDHYRSTDAWRGLTVIWLQLKTGNTKTRGERWPSTPPEVIVNGKWSRVWDMRDPAQKDDDPTTWKWSANHALCALDALRRNPIKPYADRHLWLETWRWAADVADERVPVKGGGTIPRYEVNGTIVYADGAELEDQLDPMMIAGAARFVRARGQLGIIPGCPQTPAAVLTDMLVGSGASLKRYQERDTLATSVAGTYLAPDRGYEDTALPSFTLEGAQEEDGGLDQPLQPDLSMITDHRQGQRVQKILLMRTRMQREITAEFPPNAFDLVAGSWTTTDLAAPFTRWSGLWEVQSTLPILNLEEEGGGVAYRCQLTLREISDAVYAFDPVTEEQEVEEYDLDVKTREVEPPSNVSVDMREVFDQIATGVLVPRFRVQFDASPSGSVTSYEWQMRLDGDDWPDETQRFTPTGDAERITAFGAILSQTALQDFRIKSVGSRGESGWIVVPGLARDFRLTQFLFEGGTASYSLTATAGDNPAFYGVRIYRGTSPDFSLARSVHQYTGLQPGAEISITVTDAAPGMAYLWAVPITQTYSEGTRSGPQSVTIAPSAP